MISYNSADYISKVIKKSKEKDKNIILEINCPKCNEKYKIPQWLKGVNRKCDKCGFMIRTERKS